MYFDFGIKGSGIFTPGTRNARIYYRLLLKVPGGGDGKHA